MARVDVSLASSSSAAPRVSASCASTGTLSATSSGSSANQPVSLTTSGFPSTSARIAEPEVSPIVGARSETQKSHAPMSAQRRRSST